MKKIFSLCLCLLLIGCESKEINIHKKDNGFISKNVQTLETGYVPWVSSVERMNYYRFEKDGYIYIDKFDEHGNMSTYKMNPDTFEIEWNIIEENKESVIENAILMFETNDYALYKKNIYKDDIVYKYECYYVDRNETRLIIEINHSYENINHSYIYQPYYDEINDKGYIALPKDGKCIIYEIKDGNLVEIKQVDIYKDNVELCNIDVHTMTFTYNNNAKKKVYFDNKVIDLKSDDKTIIVGDYLFVVPYRVDENIRVINLNTHKEKMLDKSIDIPYERNWTIKDNQYSFLYYSKVYKQYVHATFDGSDINLVLLGFDSNDRYLQIEDKCYLFIKNKDNIEELYKIEIK